MKKITMFVFGMLVAFAVEANAQFGSVSSVTTYLDTCGTGTWDVFTIHAAGNQSFRIQVLNDGAQAIYAVFGTDTTTTTATASEDSTNRLTVTGEYIRSGESLWFGDEGVILAVLRIKSVSGSVPYRIRKVQ